MAKSVKIRIESVGHLTITGNIGNGFFENSKGEIIMAEKSVKVPKGAEVFAGRPISDKEGNRLYELSVFTTDGTPSHLVQVTTFDQSMAWVEGLIQDGHQKVSVHPTLKTGDRVRITGLHTIKHVTDPNTGITRSYHRLAVNFPENIKRLPRIKRVPLAELREAYNKQTG